MEPTTWDLFRSGLVAELKSLGRMSRHRQRLRSEVGRSFADVERDLKPVEEQIRNAQKNIDAFKRVAARMFRGQIDPGGKLMLEARLEIDRSE